MGGALRLAWSDLRMLTRSRALALMLLAYPVVIALIVGGVLLQQGPPRVALVNEDLTGDEIRIGDDSFRVSDYVQRAEDEGVEVVRLDREEAEHALDEGQVAGVLVIPAGTAAKLRTQLSGADLVFLVGDNPLGSVVAQRMQGVIYSINLAISDALIEANRSYLDSLVTGGEVVVDGEEFDLYGLAPIEDDLEEAREELLDIEGTEELVERIDRAIEFADDAGAAISLADNALEAAAAPVRLDVQRTEGKSPVLTSQALSFALAVLVAFACVVVVGASLAAEREDAVLGRLLRGVMPAWQIVLGKLLFGAVLGTAFAGGLFVAYAVLAPQAWPRLPLLLGAVVLSALACAALGCLIAVLTRDARTATLVAIMLVLPLAPLALVNLDGPLALLEAAFPIAASRELFNAVLFAEDPWETIARTGAHLLLLMLGAAAVSTRLLRRLA